MGSPAPRCETIEQVIDEMTRRWRALHRAGDWRAVFAKTYLRTTEGILAAIAKGGIFENPPWIVELDCEFAHRYFDAFDLHEAGGECPRPWQLAFSSAIAKRTLIIQDILLGMNAHINYDLPYSLRATIPTGIADEELDVYRRDNLILNAVLASSIDAVQREVADQYDFLLNAADAALCDSDEVFAGELIRAWRARSWNSYLVLCNSELAAPAERLIEESAVDNALLLLQVQRAFPALYWPNRLWRDTLGGISRRRRTSPPL